MTGNVGRFGGPGRSGSVTRNHSNRITGKHKLLRAFEGGFQQIFENLDLNGIQPANTVNEIKKPSRARANPDLPIRHAGCELLKVKRRESGPAAQYQHGGVPGRRSARNDGLKIDTESQSHLFIGLHDTTEPLTESIFIEFLAGINIPEPASIGRKLVSEQQLAVKTAEL